VRRVGGQRGPRVRRRTGQHLRRGSAVRAVEGARLLRLRIARDGEGDVAPACRVADPVDPDQVRRVRRHVSQAVARRRVRRTIATTITASAAAAVAMMRPVRLVWAGGVWLCAGGLWLGLAASGGTSAVRAAEGLT